MKTDEQLLSAVARGEEYALELLYDAHYTKLSRYVSAILNNPEDTREVVNETFFRVFRNAGSFLGKGTFKAWLYKISANLCKDHLRKNKTTIIPLENITEPALSDITTTNLPDYLTDNLNSLKTEYRDVIILREIVGCSCEEIAQILERTSGSIRTLHHRAIKQLRKFLETKENHK